jgi:hypothetical protein
MNPFDFVNSILKTKKDIMIDAASEKGYSSFLCNRALSYHSDAILYANEMNINHHLDSKLQFHYLINTIRPASRPSVKWAKRKENDAIDAIQKYYGYNYEKAKVALSILSKEQIKIIKNKFEKGGT